MQKGKAKEWEGFFQGSSIPFTVLLDSKKKPIKQWVGAQDAGAFTRELKSLAK